MPGAARPGASLLTVEVMGAWEGGCGEGLTTDTSFDYDANQAVTFEHIPEAEMCCAMCHGTPGCVAWIWKDAGLDECPYLCTALTSEPFGTLAEAGTVSGRPPQRPQLNASACVGRGASKGAPAKPKPQPAFLEHVTEGGALDAGGGSAAARPLGSREGDNCWLRRWCEDPKARCFMKDQDWAGCRETCTPGIDPSDPKEVRTPWNCTDLTRGPAGAYGRGVSEPCLGSSLAVSGKPSLFCFSLVQPRSYENKLVEAHFELDTSIFACDAYSLYSNVSYEVVPGVITAVVKSNLICEFHEIAWNTRVFIATWAAVLEDYIYAGHDWTVKVDCDSVFLPSRLLPVLRDHADVGYLNNCRYGLHGPIEVLSLRAMAALAADYARSEAGDEPARCLAAMPEAVEGPAQWGEDMFLDKCLGEVLGVDSVIDSRLMCEAHCDCPNWYWCRNGTDRVIFHPFKVPDLLRQCVANTLELGGAAGR